MAGIKLIEISKRFGAKTVLSAVTLEIRDSEFMVFVGPSGCGKTTLLRSIAGFETPDQGDILIDGKRVNTLPPGEREVAMVFQNYALYPHMTVAENLSFCLRNVGFPKDQIRERVANIAKVLQIESLLERRPHQMSGGQRQRVAIGRAIIRSPKVYLFDEPLSNLDALLRVQTRVELAALHQRFKTTTIYVTHDQVEAMTLADRIAVMNSGRLEQVGTPLELYHTPVNIFVAGFIGSPPMNFFPAEFKPPSTLLLGGELSLPVPADITPLKSDRSLTAGVRAEDFEIGLSGEGLRAKVMVVEHLGSYTLVYCMVTLPGEKSKQVVVQQNSGSQSESVQFKPGDRVNLRTTSESVYLFDSQGRSIKTDLRYYAKTA